MQKMLGKSLIAINKLSTYKFIQIVMHVLQIMLLDIMSDAVNKLSIQWDALLACTLSQFIS